MATHDRPRGPAGLAPAARLLADGLRARLDGQVEVLESRVSTQPFREV